MRTDTSLHALRDASPRNQPGFDEWIDSFDSLRTQIPATPVQAQRPLPKPDSRHRRVVGLAITVATAVAVVGVVVGLALTAASPTSAYAAARRALAATAAAPSGTMTTTVLHGGVTHTLEVTRWNGSDLALSPDASDVAVSSIRQLLLIGGGVFVQTPDGTWLHYAKASDVPPKPLGGLVQYARDNIAGTTAQQILALATGVQKTTQPDGTTVYTGTIPVSTAGAGIAPGDGGAILRMILGVVKGKERGAPGGSLHDDLQLQMSVGGDGLVRQVSVTFQQENTGSPTTDGTYTSSISYSQLGSTPPITAPAGSTDVPPGMLPQSKYAQNVQTAPTSLSRSRHAHRCQAARPGPLAATPAFTSSAAHRRLRRPPVRPMFRPERCRRASRPRTCRPRRTSLSRSRHAHRCQAARPGPLAATPAFTSSPELDWAVAAFYQSAGFVIVPF